MVDLTTEEWIDFLKNGGLSRPVCLYDKAYKCTWSRDYGWFEKYDKCENYESRLELEYHVNETSSIMGHVGRHHTEYYCEALIDYALYANELFISNITQNDTITKLETDINEKNTRITGLESKIGELVLIEKSHGELLEKLDKKNKLIDNKNNRIDNLRDELKQSQNLADKRLDRIQNLKGQLDDNNTTIQDLIDMLQADPNTSTDDILEALKKILQ